MGMAYRSVSFVFVQLVVVGGFEAVSRCDVFYDDGLVLSNWVFFMATHLFFSFYCDFVRPYISNIYSVIEGGVYI